MSRIAALLLAGVLGAACSQTAPDDGFAPSGDAADQVCAEPPARKTGWNVPVISPLIVGDEHAHHAASDAVTLGTERVELTAAFVYGATQRMLPNESIQVWKSSQDCEWTLLGELDTSLTGTLSLSISETLFQEPGIHELRFVVGGDLSWAPAYVWKIDPGQPVVVFDIDGTLTTGDEQLFEELMFGVHADAHPGAADVVGLYAERGYLPVFLTGRPRALANQTRRWLEVEGFSRGPLFMVQDALDVIPTDAFVGEFKHGVLDDVTAAGTEPVAAYGNAPTDVCAYARAGISPESTFIIGPNAGTACDGGSPTVALDSYVDHFADLADSLPPAQ